MKIQLVSDKAFSTYGRVFEDFDAADLVTAMQETEAPADDVVYYPSVNKLEELPVAADIKNALLGQLDMQVGYCNGTNNKLNAVEYHRSSEIGVAASDLILLLGKQQDIEADFTYDSSGIEAFFVPKGTVYEMYATTLHYAPCSADGQPFRNVVILPKDTNTDLMGGFPGTGKDVDESRLLFAKNKWLIAHEEAGIKDAFVGIKGTNIEL